jgi:hypothetical protein
VLLGLFVVVDTVAKVSKNKAPLPHPAYHLSSIPSISISQHRRDLHHPAPRPPPPLASLYYQQPPVLHRASAQQLLHWCRCDCSVIPWDPGWSSSYILRGRLLQLHLSVVGARLLDELKESTFNRRFARFLRPAVRVHGAPAALRWRIDRHRHQSFSSLSTRIQNELFVLVVIWSFVKDLSVLWLLL